MNQIDDKISRQLRDEALANAPAYSPLLHERIMQQVCREQSPRAVSTWGIHHLMPLAAAAAILLASGAIWFHYQSTTKQLAITPLPPPQQLPKMNFRFPTITAIIPLDQTPYGNLDRDAKSAARFVINQLDVLPTQPGRRG